MLTSTFSKPSDLVLGLLPVAKSRLSNNLSDPSDMPTLTDPPSFLIFKILELSSNLTPFLTIVSETKVLASLSNPLKI